MILPAVPALGYVVYERIVWVLLSWSRFFNLTSLLFSWQTGPSMAACFLLICLSSIAQWPTVQQDTLLPPRLSARVETSFAACGSIDDHSLPS